MHLEAAIILIGHDQPGAIALWFGCPGVNPVESGSGGYFPALESPYRHSNKNHPWFVSNPLP